MVGQLSRFVVIPLILLAGCTTTRTSDTARTAMEQLLISNAVDQTLSKMALPPVSGRKVILDAQYLDCVDKGYVVSSLRQKLLNHGALLVGKAEDSELTVEIRSGALGTDNVNSFVGLPKLSLPGPMPLSLPEIKLIEKNSQFGTAKIGLVAYQTGTGELMFDSGRPLARSDDSRWAVLGIGPFQSGSVRREVNRETSDSDIVARVAGAVDPLQNRR